MQTLALISLFTKSKPNLLQHSYGTLFVYAYQGNLSLAVVNVLQIITVVAMLPILETTQIQSAQKLCYLIEKPGLNILHIGGIDKKLVDTDN